jgi:hypothetical protein
MRVLVTTAIALVLLTACSQHDASPPPKHALGSIGFSLRLPSGADVERIDYTITGPATYVKTGTIMLDANAMQFSAKVDGIPAAAGYELTLLGSDQSFATYDVLSGARRISRCRPTP